MQQCLQDHFLPDLRFADLRRWQAVLAASCIRIGLACDSLCQDMSNMHICSTHAQCGGLQTLTMPGCYVCLVFRSSAVTTLTKPENFVILYESSCIQGRLLVTLSTRLEASHHAAFLPSAMTRDSLGVPQKVSHRLYDRVRTQQSGGMIGLLRLPQQKTALPSGCDRSADQM